MAPSMEEYNLDYDLDLSTGGFDDHDEIIAPPLHEPLAVSIISFATNHPPRKSVSFHPVVAVRDTLSADDYTPIEYEATWMDFDEMDRIRERTMHEAMLLDVGVGSKDDSTRGLECRTKKGLQTKQRNRDNAYEAVFLEIDKQQEKRLISEHMIAEKYSFYSNPCAKVAQTIGKIDEMEAMKIHKEGGNSKKSKKSSKNSIDLESHFRRTRKTKFPKRFTNLSPRNGLVSSAA